MDYSKHLSQSEAQTRTIAQNFAKQLTNGTVVCLYGDLGVGKTAFVRGVCEYFELDREVSSPTFTLVNEYLGANYSLYHFDAYRIGSLEEAFACGLEEYFDKEGIILIEWPDMLLPMIEHDYDKVTILRQLEISDTAREVTIERVSV